MGRSWPDVSTAARPVVGLGTPVPPLPRSERAATTSSRETGRLLLEDRPRPVAPARRRPLTPRGFPRPRTADDDAELTDAELADAELADVELTGTDVPGDLLGSGVVEASTDLDVADDAHGDADGGLETDDDVAGEEHTDRAGAVTRRPRGRGPSALRHKPALLLAALVVGALIAALPGGAGSTPAAAGSGSDFGLGVETETSFAGGVDFAGARGEISQAEAEARLSEIAASRAARQPEFVVPTVGRLTTCFCMRWGSMHWGLDLAAPLGTPILAAADGVVLRAGAASGYGKAIYVQDADGDVHVYGHMRHLYVEAGDVVSAGDLIAKVGSEGQSTGPHLHYEIHKGGMNGKPIDPEDWLGERGISVR